MKKYILLHVHKYGITTYLFQCNSETIVGILNNIHSVCEMLKIDFDEDRETIHVDELPATVETIIL